MREELTPMPENVTRRRFIKRSGGATVGTAIGLYALRTPAWAQEVDDSTSYRMSCTSAAHAKIMIDVGALPGIGGPWYIALVFESNAYRSGFGCVNVESFECQYNTVYVVVFSTDDEVVREGDFAALDIDDATDWTTSPDELQDPHGAPCEAHIPAIYNKFECPDNIDDPIIRTRLGIDLKKGKTTDILPNNVTICDPGETTKLELNVKKITETNTSVSIEAEATLYCNDDVIRWLSGTGTTTWTKHEKDKLPNGVHWPGPV